MNDNPLPGLFAGQRQEPILSPYVGEVVRAALGDAVAPLSAQLEHERQRADRAEQQIEQGRTGPSRRQTLLNSGSTKNACARPTPRPRSGSPVTRSPGCA